MIRPIAILSLAVLLASPLQARPAPPDLRSRAKQALKKAAAYYRNQVALRGGYVYYYSLDLRERWGEGRASPTQIWVQPPGTPTVGMAYLDAYEATGDRFYLDAAREAAEALVFGQLESGGWTNHIDFEPSGRRAGKYRKRPGGRWDFSSLDDNQTQSALRCLLRVDRALGFKNEEIHEATQYGLNALLKAQFPNGAFPQGWRGPVEARPVRPARYPDYDWRTEGRIKNYWDMYTLNDNLAGDVASVLVDAARITKDPRFDAALAKLGDFLLLARMPGPQPAWCQQYNYEMLPIWARKFEPPAVSGWESQDVMEALLEVYRRTAEKKYLDPIPGALKYLRSSLLPDGKLARYYELRTNKPLFMTRDYKLTHDASRVPSHYGWTMPSRLDEIEKAFRSARKGNRPAPERPEAAAVERIVEALDDQGRWVSVHGGERLVGQPKFSDPRYIGSDVFSRNVGILSAWLKPKK